MGESAEVRIVGVERDDGLVLRSSGLSARDLPELRVIALPPYLGQGWAQILGLLAQRVAASGHIPDEVDLGPGGVVRLVQEEGHLTPLPPHGFKGSLDDWRRDLLTHLFPAATT
ncbi:hypothetical protein J4573_46135 [Actinomadura barringtoniae]|uniref:Uncharacterized protein n=1 Tax=Actinomadura barringtoniae TaxID=1427535 RepID=A0A939T656_9ACTN|nr:hypothetical protein [Actinomadura barringtoniae]MBO2454536.1 hypothetical protein [Actinomadura barringtoniae]